MSIPRDNYIGEPGYPAPWTTKQPLEGLRDVDEARIVSLSPDVCLTPVGSSVVPIPYPVVDYCGHDRNYTPSVRFTGQKAMVMRSCTTHVHGDAPGTRKGVKSGTVESICEPIGHAAQVRAEGSNVIRHLDRFWMNNKNTQGEAIFVRGMATYQAPEIGDPVPGSLRSQPILLAQANTGTMTDAGGGLFSPGTTTAGGQTRAPAPSIPNSQLPSAGQVARGLLLRRLGIYGIAAEEFIRELNLPAEQRAAENRALGVILSPAGDSIMTRDKLLGGRQPVTFGNILDAKTWDFSGKYGLVINDDDRVPLANDILSSIAGKPMDVRTMSDAQVKGLLSPFQGLSDKEVEQKLKDMAEARKQEEQEKKEKPNPNPEPVPVPLPDNVRIKERDKYRKKCQVDTYKVMEPICRQYGMQAHHIVPDWTLRYGTREEGRIGLKRINNMPGFWDGQSICVLGQARVSGTEHNQGHAADDAIESLGKNSTPPYTTRLENVKRESIKAMVKVRPDCARQILEAVNKEFAGVNGDQLVRAKQYPPLPKPTLDALSSGAISGVNSKQ